MRTTVSGFTLVELLVVIAIMSILTIISVSQFQTAKKKANDVARKGDLSGVSKALQLYFTDFGVFPAMSDPAGGKLVVGGVPIEWGSEFKDGSNYTYMKKMPIENVFGMPPYCYKVDATLKKFALYTKLQNTADSQCDPFN